MDFLKPLQKCMPGCITQEFMGKTRQQYVTLNCDLVNAKENLSEGMITIFQNKKKIGLLSRWEDQKITDRVVFSVEVFNNERAFAAQEAMQNAWADMICLGGQKIFIGRWTPYW